MTEQLSIVKAVEVQTHKRQTRPAMYAVCGRIPDSGLWTVDTTWPTLELAQDWLIRTAFLNASIVFIPAEE